MAALSLYPEFETSLMSNRKVTELLLQLRSAKADGKNYIEVKPHLVPHRLRNCPLTTTVSILIRTHLCLPAKPSQQHCQEASTET